MATPNLALFPSGRKATKLYSVLPTDGTGDFTVSRASQGSEINSDLKIQNVANNVPRFTYDALGGCPSLLTEPQSTNLITYPVSFGSSYWTKSGATIEGDATTAGAETVTNGVFTTDTGWNKNSNWTINVGTGRAVADGTSSSDMNQGNNTVVGATYLVSYDIVSISVSTFRLKVGGVLTAPKSTVGTYTEYVVPTNTDNLRFILSGNTICEIDNVSIKEVQGFSSPHVDYPTSAFKLVEDTSTGEHRILSANMPATTIGLYYSQSIRVKYIDTQYVSFTSGNLTKWNAGSVFDLVNGTVSNVEGGTSKIEALADGWYEISISGIVLVSDALTLMFLLSNSSTTNRPSYTGNGTSSVYIFGGQAEQQPVATSFMYNGTEGATTIRYADVVKKLSIASSILSPTEGTMFFDLSFAFPSGVKSLGLAYTNGTSYYEIYLLASNQVRVDVNGSLLMLSSAIDVTTRNKIAFAYGSGNYALYINGVSEATSTSTTLPVSLNDFYLGNTLGAAQIGGIKSNQLYNTRLTNAELIALTTL